MTKKMPVWKVKKHKVVIEIPCLDGTIKEEVQEIQGVELVHE